MKPTTDELIKDFKSYKEMGFDNVTSHQRLQGRLDVLEDVFSNDTGIHLVYPVTFTIAQEEISKIKAVLG